jgi:uncharacterized repeat protein (TIGR03803 family)
MKKPDWLKVACAVGLFCLAAAIAAPAQTFVTLASFGGSNGQSPYAPLVQGTDGNFYGTTRDGGANNYGTVFKITDAGVLTSLQSFNDSNGAYPQGPLLLGGDGRLYGTASGGEVLIFQCGAGCGTVFDITPHGALTTLGVFDLTDGAEPAGSVLYVDGDSYGTTLTGGTGSLCYGGCGTVFKIARDGTITTLHSFDVIDGWNPGAALVEGHDGGFYGTTIGGGTGSSCLNGCGTVFEITPKGVLTTLHSFDVADGVQPQGPLVQGADGSLYGTTWGGGANFNGTIFKVTPSGAFKTLHSFNYSDGAAPSGTMVQASDGDFYGTTWGGGNASCTFGCGTVFRMTPNGRVTTLHSFDSTDGSSPYGGLFEATNGKLYGTTEYGGLDGDGTIFSLDLGLNALVETAPTSGRTGSSVIVLGGNLTGCTNVTFNGTAATFTVESATYIKATVPAGATTGVVQVVAPSGTLTSNVPFRVAP